MIQMGKSNYVINSTRIGLGLNLGFYSQRPESNHLGYGAALFSLQFKFINCPSLCFPNYRIFGIVNPLG